MKKLITLLCFLPFCSFGQHMEIGFNSGYALCNAKFPDQFSNVKAKGGLYSSLQYSLELFGFRFGILGGFQVYKFKETFEPSQGFFGYAEVQSAMVHTVLTVNRSLLGGKNSDFYSGVHTGYIFGGGFIGGIQSGYTQYVGKVVGLNVEAAASYYNTDFGVTFISGKVKPERVVFFPISAGLRFRL